MIENFISEAEEELLLKLCTFDVNKEMKHRNVKHYGFEFRYDINNVDKKSPLEERLPRECEFIWKRLEDTGKWSNFQPDQLTINQYQPGQGIPFHVDTHSAFEDPLISLSLNSSIVMEFKKANKHYCVLLPRRSLAIMSGECRYDWTHGIVPRKFDVIRSECGLTNLPRKERISFTFRKVLQQDKCTCQYPTLCDSKNKDIESTTANEVEKLHVHEVYENIANHFSDTRHTPWPNVLEFVQSFHKGAILIDIGCGNGKYLGLNKNSFNVIKINYFKFFNNFRILTFPDWM